MTVKINAMRSGVLEDDMIDDVSSVAASIDHFFEQLEQVFEEDDF
jgi:hypothetical protein